jgi:hypothetical protein
MDDKKAATTNLACLPTGKIPPVRQPAETECTLNHMNLKGILMRLFSPRIISSGLVSVFGRLIAGFEPKNNGISGHFSTAFYRH